MATDRELVNFSQEHELNTVLARHGKAQSKANREMLCELGKPCKEKLGKKVLRQDEFDEFLKPFLNRLENKKA